MITGKILKQHGWPEGKTIGLAKAAAGRLEATGMGREAVLEALDRVRVAPSEHVDDPALATLAAGCLRLQRRAAPLRQDILREVPLPYRVWGAAGIDPGAIAQMDAAMRLPVSVAGALMPDAHVGYGLPIGGVLATEGVVIPYAIGVDIACRMRISVYPLSPAILDQREEQFAHALLSRTAFGAGAACSGSDRAQHEVLDDPAWNATKLLKSLHGKAEQQLGTSGTGNHFVEFGSFTLVRPDPRLESSRATTWRFSRTAARARLASRSPTPTARWLSRRTPDWRSPCVIWPGWTWTPRRARSTGCPWSLRVASPPPITR